MKQPVRALSAGTLVRQRVGDDGDPWHLALVQRNAVWNGERMCYLLDSLLAGYPVGSLLVCRVKAKSRVIRHGDASRRAQEAQEGDYQLLDGQQRVHALTCLFSNRGDCGRFFLDMTVARPEPEGPLTGRQGRRQALRYMYWQESSTPDTGPEHRQRFIDLSRWYDWAERGEPGAVALARLTLRDLNASVIPVLKAIDPEFCNSLSASAAKVARGRLSRLLDIWADGRIPVEYLTLPTPMDVLEVFTRINREGVTVAGDDLFFAAVKTLWSGSESEVVRLVEQLRPDEEDEADPLVGRVGALRLLARLGAYAAGQADILPLAVDRLSGQRGKMVIRAMKAILKRRRVLKRMADLMLRVRQESGLGFGLTQIDGRLWDHVLGWAAVSPPSSRWTRASLRSISAYLVGATAFRYHGIFGDRFGRLAMAEALRAGSQGEPFPLRRIVEVTRGKWSGLTAGRASVRGLRSQTDKRKLADRNYSLFLSILQDIPHRRQQGSFDIDHIFPQAKASLMWSPAQDGSRWRKHHKHRHFVSSAGNLWALAMSENRGQQDTLPAKKFKHLRAELGVDGCHIWPRARWWLEDTDITEFGQIGALLAAQVDIDGAMERFRTLVSRRARDMTIEVLRRYRDARYFAADARVANREEGERPDIASALGVTLPQPPTRAPSTSTTADRLEEILARADATPSGPALRRLVAKATALKLQVRPYRYTFALTPPSTRVVTLVALTPVKSGETTEVWVAPDAFAAHFPAVPAARFEARLGTLRHAFLPPAELDELAVSLCDLLRSE